MPFWVPDVRSPEFAVEAHRQSLIVVRGATAKEDRDWVDAVSAGVWDRE
jgi:hypothetical protein